MDFSSLKNNNFPEVSIVVIGKNEANNLNSTFRAIKSINYPADKYELLYVDTGSTDDSIEIAKKFTDNVYLEKSNWPTAGLARNRGLIEAKFEIIHFMDGDISIDPEYLREAISLMYKKKVDAIYGYLEEQKEGVNSILLAHWEWKKEGYSDATGGGGTYLKKPLLKINGYDERIFKGQETELGLRFRMAGYKIWFSPIKMGTHNYGVESIIDLLKRAYNMGQSSFYCLLLEENNEFFLKNKKTAINSFIFNFFMLSIIVLSILGYYLISIFALSVYIIYFLINHFFLIKIKTYNSLKYFLIMEITKPAFFIGQILMIYKVLKFWIKGKKIIYSKQIF